MYTSTLDPYKWEVSFSKKNQHVREFMRHGIGFLQKSGTPVSGCYHTFHFFLKCKTAMNPLQFRFHCQPTNVCLQVCAVHHANPKHYQSNMLRFSSYQTTFPLVTLVLSCSFSNTTLHVAPVGLRTPVSKWKYVGLDTAKWKDATLLFFPSHSKLALLSSSPPK